MCLLFRMSNPAIHNRAGLPVLTTQTPVIVPNAGSNNEDVRGTKVGTVRIKFSSTKFCFSCGLVFYQIGVISGSSTHVYIDTTSNLSLWCGRSTVNRPRSGLLHGAAHELNNTSI